MDSSACTGAPVVEQPDRRVEYAALTDSQAAILMLRIHNDAPGPGQGLAIQIIHLASLLHRREDTVIVRWVPGHHGVEGDEVVDLTPDRPPRKPPYDVQQGLHGHGLPREKKDRE